MAEERELIKLFKKLNLKAFADNYDVIAQKNDSLEETLMQLCNFEIDCRYSAKVKRRIKHANLEVDFCTRALERSLETTKPEIFNTDQGSQFTSDEFICKLKQRDIRISMDSVGRALDNIVVERFWRSMKYENTFLTEYESAQHAKQEINSYIDFYNNERIHQSLDYYTPYEIYFGKEVLK